MLNTFSTLLREFNEHSILEYPREACGIILKDFSYKRAKNISPKPKISFIVDPILIYTYQDDIWGFYHSHPGSFDPIPSILDTASTVFSQYKFIVGYADKNYIYWTDTDNKLKFEEFNASHINN